MATSDVTNYFIVSLATSNITNYFIVSLATSDVMVALLVMPLSIYCEVGSYHFYCQYFPRVAMQSRGYSLSPIPRIFFEKIKLFTCIVPARLIPLHGRSVNCMLHFAIHV